jgi:hypothetical protein
MPVRAQFVAVMCSPSNRANAVAIIVANSEHSELSSRHQCNPNRKVDHATRPLPNFENEHSRETCRPFSSSDEFDHSPLTENIRRRRNNFKLHSYGAVAMQFVRTAVSQPRAFAFTDCDFCASRHPNVLNRRALFSEPTVTARPSKIAERPIFIAFPQVRTAGIFRSRRCFPIKPFCKREFF